MKKKKTSKQKQRMKYLIIMIIILFCCLTLPSITHLFGGNKTIYKFDSRLKEIEKEKKKDKTGYETIAWLRVQGTNIDSPIVIFPNEDKNDPIEFVDKEDYLWNENPNEKLFNKVNILGHNILNLSSTPEVGLEYFSRFDDLMSFVYTDFAEENKYIQYTIDGKDYMYKIFGAYFEEQYNLDLYTKEDYTKEKMTDFIKNVKEKSLYDYNVDVTEDDKIISLVTCTRMFGKDDSREFAVVARQVREDEKLTNYDIKETKNYENIKKILKGDKEENEEV